MYSQLFGLLLLGLTAHGSGGSSSSGADTVMAMISVYGSPGTEISIGPQHFTILDSTQPAIAPVFSDGVTTVRASRRGLGSATAAISAGSGEWVNLEIVTEACAHNVWQKPSYKKEQVGVHLEKEWRKTGTEPIYESRCRHSEFGIEVKVGERELGYYAQVPKPTYRQVPITETVRDHPDGDLRIRSKQRPSQRAGSVTSSGDAVMMLGHPECSAVVSPKTLGLSALEASSGGAMSDSEAIGVGFVGRRFRQRP
jgi:hypothetical protein